jgi:hypothetical protein
LPVRKVESVAAPSMDEVRVWLGTTTDAERDALLGEQEAKVDRICRIR